MECGGREGGGDTHKYKIDCFEYFLVLLFSPKCECVIVGSSRLVTGQFFSDTQLHPCIKSLVEMVLLEPI